MASVWHEQVAKAFKSLIEATVILNGLPIRTLTRNPESEFSIGTYPCATIYNTGITFAKYRFDDYWANGVKNEASHTLEVLPPAMPYDLDYRIEFWSKYQSEINDIARQWLGKIPHNGYLTVVEYTDGQQVDVTRDCTMFNIATVNGDILKPDSRIFRRIYDYRIWVELDERLPVIKPMVTTRVITQEEMP